MAKNPLITSEIEIFIKTRRFLDAVRKLMSEAGISLLEAKSIVDTYRIEELEEKPEPKNVSISRNVAEVNNLVGSPMDLLGEPSLDQDEEAESDETVQKLYDLEDEISGLLQKDNHDSTIKAIEIFDQYLDATADVADKVENIDEQIDAMSILVNYAIILHVPEQAESAFKIIKEYTNKDLNAVLQYTCLYALFVAYSEGRGTQSDPKKAYECLSEASFIIDEGDSSEIDIFIAMAQCYINGWGVEFDTEKAKEYYELARNWKCNDPESKYFGKPIEQIIDRYSLEILQMLTQLFDPEAANASCNVKLTGIGNDKRAIRTLLTELCSISLGDAVKYMVQVNSGNPIMISEGITRSEADDIVSKICAAGGTAEIE